VWGSTGNGCSACHTTAIGATGPATGGHALHAETTCTLCHNAGTTSATKPSTEHADGDIDTNNVGYTDNKVKGSVYTTCSTASCHADVYASGTVATPVWGSTGNGCSACHTTAIGATGPATGSHSAHMSATVKVNGSSIVCVNCHNAGTTSATKPSTEHADGDIDTLASVGYTDNKAKGSIYTTCSTASCHTNGQDASGTTITQKVTATWGTPATCTTCHDFNGSMQPTTANHTTHITRTGGTCVQCHDVYGDNTTEPDLNSPVHINNIINVAQGGVVSFGYNGDSSGTGNHAPGYGYGSCSTVSCHGGGATRTWGQMGDSCTDCHSNLGGPTGGDRGHAFHVQTAYVGAITTSSYGDYTVNNWYSYSNTGGTPDIGCGYCHPQSDATHNNGVVNLNFASSDTGATGTLKAKNGSESYSQAQRSSVTCSSVYCHSDGFANPGYGYKTSPEWFAGNFVGDKCDDCHGNSPTSNSHDSHVVGIHYAGIYTGSTGLANTSGTANTNSHGSSTYSTTISCSTCHNNTVTQTANAGNNTCTICHTDTNTPATGNEFAVIYASATTHVNGTPDVAFNAINVKSKAQVRDNITTITDLNQSWNRAASGVSYKAAGAYDQANIALNTPTMFDNITNTCSTVACHNGNSVKWGDTGVTCNNCHTDLTK
ncbi:MAG: CxxxxCH/CxxCH domain-containing protein, partial [Nitrospirae bacterium]|nr:CxxxxCH/CxxCH domain-containing protein [Nitrospirota bacterium]